MPDRVTSASLLESYAARHQAARAPGMSLSRVGGCRREVAYLLAETEPSDEGKSGRQAAIGQALHAVIAEEARLAGLDAEQTVTFDGIPGHFDRFERDSGTVVDSKTCYNKIARIKNQGPPTKDRWQVNLYALALILAGETVRYVRIEYLDRATGEEYVHEEPVNVAAAREALEWLRLVRETPLDMVPRDFLPSSPKCQGCPFRTLCWEGGIEDRAVESVLYVEHPHAKEWALMLARAKAEEKDAKARKDTAKAALDAIRPDDGGTVVADGVTFVWRWRNGNAYPDMEQIAAFYAEHGGGEVPMRRADGYWLLTSDVDATEDEEGEGDAD